MRKRIHHKQLISFLLLLLCATLLCGTAAAEKTEVVNLGGYATNWLSYKGTLPDGRIVLAGYRYFPDEDNVMRRTPWLLCLNSDRTVSWEYTDDSGENVGYAATAVLPDGTIGTAHVRWQDSVNTSVELRFLTPDGKPTGKEVSAPVAGFPSFIDATETRLAAHFKADDKWVMNCLFDWEGNLIAVVDIRDENNENAAICWGIIGEPDGIVMYGAEHQGAVWKTDFQGNLVWRTLLPGVRTDEGIDRFGTVELAEKTADGGYLAILQQELHMAGYEDDVYRYALVKLDSTGNMLRMDREIFGDAVYGMRLQGFGQYNGKYAAMFTVCDEDLDGCRIDNPRKFIWFDENGTGLGITELNMQPEDFDWLPDSAREPAENGSFTAVIPGTRMFSMQDGLWMPAEVEILTGIEGPEGRSGYSVDAQYSREVLIRVPEP